MLYKNFNEIILDRLCNKIKYEFEEAVQKNGVPRKHRDYSEIQELAIERLNSLTNYELLELISNEIT